MRVLSALPRKIIALKRIGTENSLALTDESTKLTEESTEAQPALCWRYDQKVSLAKIHG